MTPIPLYRLQTLLYNRALLVMPQVALRFSDVLQRHVESRITGIQVERDDDASTRERRPASLMGDVLGNESGTGSTPYTVTKAGTAVIPIIGTLVNRGDWIGADCGLVSYDGIKYQLAAAVADSRVRGILLDIESPGGEAAGAFGMAAAVGKAAADKPVVTFANALSASAAYGLTAAATRRFIVPDGIAGSIGVVMLHVDFSVALQAAGVKPTLIFAGAHKVDGNPYEALPADVRDGFQAEVNKYYDMFVATVAAGTTGLSEAAVRETEAQVFIGSDAVKVGLVDQVGSLDEALAATLPKTTVFVSTSMSARKASTEGSMSVTTEQNAGNDLAAQLAAERQKNADLAAKFAIEQGERAKAELTSKTTAANAKVDAWERDGMISGNATVKVREVFVAIATGQAVTAEQFEGMMAALPKFDTSRVAQHTKKSTVIDSDVTLDDFAKQATSAAASQRIAAAVAARRKDDPKFTAADLRRELQGKK